MKKCYTCIKVYVYTSFRYVSEAPQVKKKIKAITNCDSSANVYELIYTFTQMVLYMSLYTCKHSMVDIKYAMRQHLVLTSSLHLLMTCQESSNKTGNQPHTHTWSILPIFISSWSPPYMVLECIHDCKQMTGTFLLVLRNVCIQILPWSIFPE